VFHLTRRQIDRLLAQPDLSTSQGLRDVTAIGLIYCAGISETELCSLQVSDLNQEIDGETAIHIPETAGGTERLAPLYDGLLFTEKWLQRYLKEMMDATRVTEGYVFKGFFRGGQRMRGNSLSPRAVQKMLKGYPIQDAEGHEITATALDLRRTYARQLFEESVSFDDIHHNLGNINKRTTLEYIGLPQKANPENNDLGDASILLSKLRERRGY
jgi:integrase/recombinase XerD